MNQSTLLRLDLQTQKPTTKLYPIKLVKTLETSKQLAMTKLLTLTKLDCLLLTNSFDAYAAERMQQLNWLSMKLGNHCSMPMKVFTNRPPSGELLAQSGTKEGCSLFESAVITGQIDNKSNGDTDQNQPKNVKTRCGYRRCHLPQKKLRSQRWKRLMATVSVNHTYRKYSYLRLRKIQKPEPKRSR